MTMTLYMKNGKTIEEYIDQQVNEKFESRLIEHLTEHLTINVSSNWYNPNEKEVKVYFKDTLVCWDYL